MTDLQKMLAEFAARGGKVTVVPAGTRTMTEKQIYLAQRDPVATVIPSASKVDNAVRIITDHAGREFYQNAEGEWL